MAGETTTNLKLQKIKDTDYAGNFPTIYNNNLDLIDRIGGHINYLRTRVDSIEECFYREDEGDIVYLNLWDLSSLVEGKQDKLIAGSGITIAADGKTISSTGGNGYTAGDGIQISSDGVISTKAPSEITVYSPIVLGFVNATNDIRYTTTDTELTVVNFGTGKRTTNSYSIPITNSLKKFNSKNGILASTQYINITPSNLPSFLPKDGTSINLSILVLDGQFVSLGTYNAIVTSNRGSTITVPNNTKVRDGSLSAYLINVNW